VDLAHAQHRRSRRRRIHDCSSRCRVRKHSHSQRCHSSRRSPQRRRSRWISLPPPTSGAHALAASQQLSTAAFRSSLPDGATTSFGPSYFCTPAAAADSAAAASHIAGPRYPPLVAAAGKPNSTGSEHALLKRAKEVGFHVAKYDEGCHTAPTVQPAAGPELPSYTFPAPLPGAAALPGAATEAEDAVSADGAPDQVLSAFGQCMGFKLEQEASYMHVFKAALLEDMTNVSSQPICCEIDTTVDGLIPAALQADAI